MSLASAVTSSGTASFEGIEWDLEYTVDRHIAWKDSLGGPPRGLAVMPNTAGVSDGINATFTVWTPSANAANLEAMLPPYGDGYKFDLLLPGLSDTQAFPGFGQWDGTSNAWKLVSLTPNSPAESMGRKAPIVDLWGYRFDLHFSAAGGGDYLNELNGQNPYLHGRGSMPSFFGRKFIAHQIQDWSRSATPFPYPNASFTTRYTGVQHGRRRDGAISFDHLSATECQQLVDWFRLVKATPFSYTTDQPFGPGQPNTVNTIARELTVNRGAGWWWDARLEVTLYI